MLIWTVYHWLYHRMYPTYLSRIGWNFDSRVQMFHWLTRINHMWRYIESRVGLVCLLSMSVPWWLICLNILHWLNHLAIWDRLCGANWKHWLTIVVVKVLSSGLIFNFCEFFLTNIFLAPFSLVCQPSFMILSFLFFFPWVNNKFFINTIDQRTPITTTTCQPK